MKETWKMLGMALLVLFLCMGRPVWHADLAAAKLPDGAGTVSAKGQSSYEEKDGKVIVYTPQGVREYRCYSQTEYGYKARGCVVTATAIAASAFGSTYSPRQIQEGGRGRRYSVRYAVRRMGGSDSMHQKATISVMTAAQVLKDIGIDAKAVCRFTKEEAIREITEHVEQGKPVLIKANAEKHDGVQIANAHHALLLVGLDEDGYGIFIDPMKGEVNYAHGSGNYFHMKIGTMVKYHMTQASGDYTAPYVTSLRTAGGYILIG